MSKIETFIYLVMEKIASKNKERRHFSRNPTGHPSRPRERKIGDD
jgi:hypothetical protein